MSKRSNGNGGGKSKKHKVNGFIDPNTSGIYVTCHRGREQQCRKELMNLFSEKIEEYYDLDELDDKENSDEENLSIEDQIKKELNDLRESKSSKKELLKPIDLGCECLIFIKTRRPIDPESFVERLCCESLKSNTKTTRYTQKLTPITYSVSPTIEEVKKLAKRVLKPHFHAESQKPYKFAIQITRRNFNALPKPDMIKAIAECVGHDHGHSVDLKKYDKLILVECYKSNVGMSVANSYDELEKFNLQQIFEKHTHGETNELSRVKKTEESNNNKLMESKVVKTSKESENLKE